MAKQDDEYTSKPLRSEIDPALRPLRSEFYRFLADDPSVIMRADVAGPAALSDRFFDRMMQERPILKFLVSRLGDAGLTLVQNDITMLTGEDTPVDSIPNVLVNKLNNLREEGEWDASEESRELRRSLLGEGLLDHADHPLIVEAVRLGETLQPDGHEIYAQDAVVAVAGLLRQIDTASRPAGSDPNAA